MVIQNLLHWLAGILIWVAGLLPQFHLVDIGGLGDAVAELWQQAASWSGVIPLQTVSLIFQGALLLAGFFGTVNIVRIVANLIRGSGA